MPSVVMAVIRSIYEIEKTNGGYKGKINFMGFDIGYFAKRIQKKDLPEKEAYTVHLSKSSRSELEYRLGDEDDMDELENSLGEGVMASIQEYKKEKAILELGVKVSGEETDWDFLRTDVSLTLSDMMAVKLKQEYFKKLMGD